MKQQKNLITLHRGEVLFRQGEYGSSMFEVVQGRLDIVADEGKKTETRIAAIEQGQCFGMSGILECTPRIATAVAAQWDAAWDAMSRATALDIACKIH